ncbi:hypothetical protein CRG98_021528 [Punica granatum]|uniref:Uncharacterized protein n=1 Tax=Punica granatum TaxID=22663 RepID=A0A2I0JP71_PUNGR|nr:hypothetical protein CRG98_021528 [Punica granatum]
MRARSSVAAEVNETGGRSAPEDVGGGRCVGRAPEYVGSTPAGVRGGRACVCGGRERVGTEGLTSSETSRLSAPHFGSPFQIMILAMIQATT